MRHWNKEGAERAHAWKRFMVGRREDAFGGPRHFGRHGGGGERGMRGGRMFGHGGLRLVLLKLIAEKPAHGYELIKDIEDRLRGAYSPSPGVVYPTLTHLEELGYVNQTPEDGGRKLYTITEAGKAHLEESKAEVDAMFARISEASGRGGRPPQVMRAVQNLRMAIDMRLQRGELTEEQVNALAAALDTAAQAVERV